jgi:CheY-like chemotaxis protein
MLTLGVLLRSEGYIVELAKDGAEALKLAATFRPEVTLLDLLMPGQSGFDVAQELQRRYGNECPVLIAVSGQGGAQTEERAELSGFDHYISKPYDRQALLQLMESLDPGG